jgi:hypothetical protein
MNVSLDQPIEIHAHVLARKHDKDGPPPARERTYALRMVGDYEGHSVWLTVAQVAEQILNKTQSPMPTPEEPTYSAIFSPSFFLTVYRNKEEPLAAEAALAAWGLYEAVLECKSRPCDIEKWKNIQIRQ